MCFCIIKNQNNEKVFNEIELKLSQYAIDKKLSKIDDENNK